MLMKVMQGTCVFIVICIRIWPNSCWYNYSYSAELYQTFI